MPEQGARSATPPHHIHSVAAGRRTGRPRSSPADRRARCGDLDARARPQAVARAPALGPHPPPSAQSPFVAPDLDLMLSVDIMKGMSAFKAYVWDASVNDFVERGECVTNRVADAETPAGAGASGSAMRAGAAAGVMGDCRGSSRRECVDHTHGEEAQAEFRCALRPSGGYILRRSDGGGVRRSHTL